MLLRLKHADTQRILTLFAVLALVTAGVSVFSWVWALAVATVLTFAGLGFLIAHYHRATEEELVLQAQDLQDLQFIQSAISPVRPLPYFTRWSSSPALAARLIGIIKKHKPQHIVELGSGVSTVVMALAARDAGSGHVTSLDHDPVYAAKTRNELAEQGLSEWATVIDAPLESVDTPRGSVPWYDLSSIDTLQPIDLLIVDGPPRKSHKDARLPAYELLGERMAPGAHVVLDDTARKDENGSVAAWTKVGDTVASIPSRKGITIIRMPR